MIGSIIFRRAINLSLLISLVLCLTVVLTGQGRSDPNVLPHTEVLRSSAAKHGVRIITATDPAYFKDSRYAAILGAEFSGLEPENAMKFGPVHPRPNTDPHPYDFSVCDQLISFAQQHNMGVRGHTLVWHNQNPDWLTHGDFTPKQLRAILRDHITTVLKHFGTNIYAYDVVNEAFDDDGKMHSTLWYDKPGIGLARQGTKYIEQALRWAHAASPSAKLFYNDYNNETIGPKSDAIYAMARDFKQRGVPLSGVGLQMHVALDLDDPAKLNSLSADIKRVGDLGLEVDITELDIRVKSNDTASLVAQAKLYGEIVSVCIQQPSCKLIQTWGLTDKYSWVPGFFSGYGWALLWDDKYQKKPSYYAMLKALQ